MNVLSLFDGMSCGKVALDRLGFTIDNYFASEIDESAIKVSKKNHPHIIHLGYTKTASERQRFRMLGNGWTVDVIAFILSFIPQS